MSDRLARVALGRLGEPGDVRLSRLVSQLGAETVYAELRQERDLGGFRTEVAARLRDLDPERELDDAAASGLRFVIPGDREWPSRLDDLASAEPVDRRGGAPLGLWLRGPGMLSELSERAVAVVGSRSATSYGAHVTGEIASHLAQREMTTISGAAFGIDQAAHRGSLAARGPTIAILACGADRPYPLAHERLLDYIADEGLVVSELSPGCAPTRLRFLVRNRLIAALAQGTVVVEAAARSGALNTANWSGRLHRVVMGVPGQVTSAQSEGVHELIRTGRATLVTGGADVVELISPVGSFGATPVRGKTLTSDGLSESGVRVLDALPVLHGASVSSLARTSGLAEGSVRTCLEELVRLGLAERIGDFWRLHRSDV